MITKVTIRRFKRFNDVEIELGNPVVFIGPNNSGKTTALQALALWDIGIKRWNEKRGKRKAMGERPGVTINRRDLITIPVPNAKILWQDLHVRDVQKDEKRQQTRNIRIEIEVEGITYNKYWKCGLEFDYANEESFYCRPLRISEGSNPQRMEVPEEATRLRIAFLPPMSGLAANETRLDIGAINVRLGEGRTAEVLRNLCYQIIQGEDGNEKWTKVCNKIDNLFGVKLDDPQYSPERGEITMNYRDQTGVRLDLSASGRGLQQTLLLLSHLSLNPGSILLLDEPDAHLEILRQRQIYQVLTDAAREQNSQIIAASHSEVILNEAADRDVVIAFLGKPHRIDDRGSQVLKSLKEIGYEQYYQAEQTGWVLYLEGSTDLAILYSFSKKLNHPAMAFLERPFVHYVQNQPQKARNHFCGLREAKNDLVAIAIFDRLEQTIRDTAGLREYMWGRREIENYICFPTALIAYAESSAFDLGLGPLFENVERENRRNIMEECINDLVPPAALRDLSDRWWRDTKSSDDFLDRLFETFFQKLGLPNLIRKTDYHILTEYVPIEAVDPEISDVLDIIVSVASEAKPIN
ncbi:MAG: AAA family ATPase [Deltaproteobacteria bacterium]|nr:AAA family ATPase [Deltaproteobacteria bacterium]